ncbi:hypothetical protein DBR32_12470 [Taibaiella sp. KBW10]|nr:hypothetical protein DBR32_12470 [Taibaiella sp. KBW10]
MLVVFVFIISKKELFFLIIIFYKKRTEKVNKNIGQIRKVSTETYHMISSIPVDKDVPCRVVMIFDPDIFLVFNREF